MSTVFAHNVTVNKSTHLAELCAVLATRRGEDVAVRLVALPHCIHVGAKGIEYLVAATERSLRLRARVLRRMLRRNHGGFVQRSRYHDRRRVRRRLPERTRLTIKYMRGSKSNREQDSHNL